MGGGGGNCDYQTTKWKYQNLPTTNDQFWGGGVNSKMQIVTTKLPNENIQTYQLQMINSGGGGGGEIVTTKWKYPNLPTTNDWFWGGVNYQMQIATSFLSLTCEIVFVVDRITPRIGSLPILPQFDQNFLDTGLGFASQRIYLRKTNNDNFRSRPKFRVFCSPLTHSFLRHFTTDLITVCNWQLN